MEAIMNRRVIVLCWLFGSSLAGCKDDVRCERARLDLNKAWSELRQAAARRKLEGADMASWTDIEKKADLLESSFMTRQVTWESASRAAQEIAAKLPALDADRGSQLVSFRNSAESALKQQASFEKECR